MPIEIMRINREDDRAWAVMPRLLKRIAEFCGTTDSETDPNDLVELVRAWFCTNDHRLGLWVAMQGEQLVGHLFATPEPLGSDKWRYVLIRQASVDPGVNVPETQAVFDAVKAWTKGFGLTRIGMLTHRNAEAFARRWQFANYKALMMHTIEP